MQKYLDILERNVQWFALGLGGIFLLWMIYANVVQPPAVTEINKKPYTPDTIVDATLNGPVKQLNEQMNSKEGIDIPRLDAVAQFNSQVQQGPKVAVAEAEWPWDGKTGKLDITDRTKVGPTVGEFRMALANVPAPVPVQAVAGMSTVDETPPQAPDAPQNNNPRARAPRNNAAAQPVAKQDDLLWASYFFKIPAADLQKAFEKSLDGQTPENPEILNTWIVQVDVQRQEMTGPDTWGPAQTVKSLHIYQLQQAPADGADQRDKLLFKDWSAQHQEEIARPAFYPVVYGDDWMTPEQREAKDAAPQPGANPRDRFNPNNNPRRPYFDPRRQPGRRSYVLEDPERPAPSPYEQYRQQYRGRGGYPYDSRMLRGGRGFGGFQQGGAGQGAIDPTNLQDDIEIWGHDEHVEPGRTYRYQMRYHLYNPLFGTSNIAKNPDDTKKLDLASPWSDWTKPVKVPENVRFFVVSAAPPSKATVEIYRWKAGNWKMEPARPGPGDPVGTDYTVVDVRRDPKGGTYVMLLNNKTDELVRHDPQTDANSPDYTKLKDEVSKPAEAALDQQPVAPSIRERLGPTYGRPRGR